MKTQGQLWIVAAPSGGGKTTLVNACIEKMDKLVRSVSFTTRPKRAGEVDGRDYVFVDKDKFERLIVDKQMLEYETVFDNYYGTSLAFINAHLAEGKDVILTIDWQGARHVRKTVSDSKGIFILPPSVEALLERLENRGQEDPAVIARRMSEAKAQMSHYDEFDYLIVNDNFDEALAQMLTIFAADRLRRARQQVTQATLIKTLLTD